MTPCFEPFKNLFRFKPVPNLSENWQRNNLQTKLGITKVICLTKLAGVGHHQIIGSERWSAVIGI